MVIKRLHKYNIHIDKIIQFADNVMIGRLYDGTIVQYFDNKFISVNGEIYNKNDRIGEACINACRSNDIDYIPEGIYQAVGPDFGTNWDDFEFNTLISIKDEVKNKRLTIDEMRQLVLKDDWFGVIVMIQKQNIIKVYCLDRQFFNIDMVKNKLDVKLVKEITAKVYEQLPNLNAVLLYKLVLKSVKKSVISSYIKSGHKTDFINLLIKNLREVN